MANNCHAGLFTLHLVNLLTCHVNCVFAICSSFLIVTMVVSGVRRNIYWRRRKEQRPPFWFESARGVPILPKPRWPTNQDCLISFERSRSVVLSHSAFSHDVTSAMSVFQNNSLGVEPFSYAKTFFYSWLLSEKALLRRFRDLKNLTYAENLGIFLKALLVAFSISYVFTVSVHAETIVNNTICKWSPELIFPDKSRSHVLTAVNPACVAGGIYRALLLQSTGAVIVFVQAVTAS